MLTTSSSHLTRILLCSCVAAAAIYVVPNIKIQREPISLDWDDDDTEFGEEMVDDKENTKAESALID